MNPFYHYPPILSRHVESSPEISERPDRRRHRHGPADLAVTSPSPSRFGFLSSAHTRAR